METTVRENWTCIHRKIWNHYSSKPVPTIVDTDGIFAERLLAPCLVSENASTRSAPAEFRAGRRYPTEISHWADFKQSLESFQPENQALSRRGFSPFYLSMLTGKGSFKKRDERQERRTGRAGL